MPFALKQGEEKPREDRSVVTSVGVLDRDHCGSLEVGVRVPNGSKGKTKKRRVLTLKKGVPTPRRPKVVKRKGVWKVAARVTVDVAGSASGSTTLSKHSERHSQSTRSSGYYVRV